MTEEDTLTLKLFNTESRSKEQVLGPVIKMYTCGPTVYNFAHIGNFRTYVFEDLLRRALKFFSMRVIQAMNITDVEDKIIKAALEKQVPLDQFTAPYIQAFFEDLATLNVEKVEFYPHATEYIDEMIKIIQKLLDNGVAYKTSDGSIFYAIEKFPSYGRLSHLHLDELKAGASERVNVDEYEKEHIADFVLWKSYDPKRDGQVFWEAPFGKGRPGWHIECSAMAIKVLGQTLDIHVGGVDNMFPHHENEIAQSEAYSGQPFVKHWLHCEHLLVDGKKMSKRLGNFYTLRDLLNKGYTGRDVRYMLLHTHYRTQLNFTFEGLDGAVHSLERLDDFVRRLKTIKEEKEETISSLLKGTEAEFAKALADDLNISVALASLFELVRKINGLVDQNKIGKKDAEATLALLNKFNTVLGVLQFEPEEEIIPQELEELLRRREEARGSKNWKIADECRDKILGSGYLIEDTPHGARLKKKKS